MENKEKIEISPYGSLGLLAIGYRGLLAWRLAKEKYQKETKQRIDNFYIEIIKQPNEEK